MFTIEPPPRRSMWGITCLHVRNTLVRFTASTSVHDSSLTSTGPPGSPGIATLLWRMSIAP